LTSAAVGSDHEAQLQAARAWRLWESQTITLLPDPSAKAKNGDGDGEYALAFARIENHGGQSGAEQIPLALIEGVS